MQFERQLIKKYPDIMTTQELSEKVAKSLLGVLQRMGLLKPIKQKDNLTDLTQYLASSNQNSSGNQSSLAPGAVIASDGTVVTLGQNHEQNNARQSAGEEVVHKNL